MRFNRWLSVLVLDHRRLSLDTVMLGAVLRATTIALLALQRLPARQNVFAAPG